MERREEHWMKRDNKKKLQGILPKRGDGFNTFKILSATQVFDTLIWNTIVFDMKVSKTTSFHVDFYTLLLENYQNKS